MIKESYYYGIIITTCVCPGLDTNVDERYDDSGLP